MGKRSDFERRPMDDYATPVKAVAPLKPFLGSVKRFAEPCSGDGALIAHLEACGLSCAFSGDLRRGFDALQITKWDVEGCDAIITNPPWTRSLLHPMIDRFRRLKPTWLLFDADWMHTKQASPYLPYCSDIVSVGRLKWIEGSKYSGKDNVAWFRFTVGEQRTRFHGPMDNRPAIPKDREAANDNHSGVYWDNATMQWSNGVAVQR